MPAWWDELTAEERNREMATWPRQTVLEFMDLADAKVASGTERTKAEQEAFEQLLEDLYPGKVPERPGETPAEPLTTYGSASKPS